MVENVRPDVEDGRRAVREFRGPAGQVAGEDPIRRRTVPLQQLVVDHGQAEPEGEAVLVPVRIPEVLRNVVGEAQGAGGFAGKSGIDFRDDLLLGLRLLRWCPVLRRLLLGLRLCRLLFDLGRARWPARRPDRHHRRRSRPAPNQSRPRRRARRRSASSVSTTARRAAVSSETDPSSNPLCYECPESTV